MKIEAADRDVDWGEKLSSIATTANRRNAIITHKAVNLEQLFGKFTCWGRREIFA